MIIINIIYSTIIYKRNFVLHILIILLTNLFLVHHYRCIYTHSLRHIKETEQVRALKIDLILTQGVVA